MGAEQAETLLDIKASCTKCGSETIGRLYFTPEMRLVDSDGGLAFRDGWRCHNCIGQPWASADVIA